MDVTGVRGAVNELFDSRLRCSLGLQSIDFWLPERLGFEVILHFGQHCVAGRPCSRSLACTKVHRRPCTRLTLSRGGHHPQHPTNSSIGNSGAVPKQGLHLLAQGRFKQVGGFQRRFT